MSDEVFSERSGPFSVTVDLASALTSLEVHVPGHRPLVAVLDGDEMRAAVPIFDRLVEYARRDGSAYVDLRAAFRDAIGRDPFAGQQARPM